MRLPRLPAKSKFEVVYIKKSVEKFDGFFHFMWIFSHFKQLCRTPVRRR